MSVRRATPKDARRLAELRYEFREGLGEATEDRDEFVERCTAWMAARLEGTAYWACWVWEADGVVRGHLWLALIEKVPNPLAELEWHGYITNVYVQPEARGAGAGAALMGAAMAYCRERGVDSVILWPTRRSRSLYGRHGFEEPDDIMEARLDPGRHLP